ncbi:M12 family metallopeptidase [Pyxidicoccus fallax]|uniref:M12 family metallopeptidase n=1 Tax=Pyxidicoccus fallax TaxID=394095 RepID=UPI001B7D5921|nr:M12 family metallopeptidase [Pyxidicoccus fallax]
MSIGNAPHRGPALLVALGLGLGSLAGCGEGMEPLEPTASSTVPAESLGSNPADLYVASSTLWRPMNVPVCWENPGANAQQRQWVRDAVARTWEARSGVRFTGWGTCPATSSGIRITISDTGPHVKALGNRLNGMAQGMVLNFTFNNWSTSCRSQLQYCIDAIAVHEFGHAMGFAHEQNRPDRPSTCTEPAQGSSGDWLIGPWDLSSVMNYCNPQWNGNGNLSATDQEGARLTYGVTWESLGGGLVGSPSATSWGSGHLDIYVRGTDNALWHRWFGNNAWSGWESLGGTLASEPAAVAWSEGRIDVFARGTDGSLIHKWHDNGVWSGWESLGGQIVGKPAVVSWAPGHLDVYVRGTDNGLHHRWFGTNGWSDWEWLGGELTSEPSVASWAEGRIDVFARGTDGSLLHKWYDTGTWFGWESLGGTLVGGPSAVSWGAGHLDVYVRGADNALHHRWFGNNAWSGWEWLGGELTSAPSAASWGTGRLDVFYRGPDTSLRHSWFNNGW